MVDTGTNTGKAAFAAALGAVFIGACVLAGWLFDVEFLKRIAAGLVAMNPATAVAFIFPGASLALFLLQSPDKHQESPGVIVTARLCALVVTLIGVVKLIGILWGLDLGIDRWLFASKLLDGLRGPNRIALTTALNFLLFGGALLFADVKKRSVRSCAELSVSVAGFVSLLAVLGYAYGLGAFMPMALNTAIAFLVLVVAFLLSHTDSGLLAVLQGDSAGGAMARRLLPAAVLVPAGFGWLTQQGQKTGLYGGEFGVALFAVANILAFTLLISWSARGLFIADLRRKQVEKALRESNENFCQLADNVTDAFWVRSPDARELHYISPAFEQIWGRSMESLHANPLQWPDFIVPEDRERVTTVFAGLVKETPSLDIDYRIMRPSGEIRWVRVRGFQVRDAAHKLIRLTGLVTDITERHLAAEKLRESERRFSDMLRNLALVSMMLDRDARITYCNDYLLRLTGWQRDEVIGGDWFEIFLPPEITKTMREVHSALLADQPAARHHENQIVTRSGARRLIRWSNSLLRSAAGDAIGTASIGEDITDRNRLEARLLESQKLETVGKLAGGVAHEFNSIMTTIIGQSELLLNNLSSESALRKNAAEIRRAADKAAMLTKQLLAYGRKQIFRPEILDLNSVLASMESSLRHLMGPGVEVRIDLAAGLQAVKADAGQIEQVILNIAMNGGDAMPDGGRLTLKTANVTLDPESAGRFPDLEAGEYVMLAITDTGEGLSEEVRAHVFEPFFTTKAVGRGTGLGLSTCYGIIKQSGGHISVYSELARGTTVTTYLPQVDRHTRISIRPLDSPDLPRGSETILLVEDDTALREMAAALLRRLGYTVLAAANGIEALSLTPQGGAGHADLLFTDVIMPYMSGKELSERVQALSPGTRILFTSASADKGIVHQGALKRGVALLHKPFTPSALAHKLREVLDA